MAKRDEVAKKIVDMDAGTVTWKFADGREIVIGYDDLPDTSQRRAGLHGISQKGGDSYAGAESLDEAYESVQEVAAQLIAGEWSVRKPGEPRIGMLAEAIARMRKKSVAEIMAKLSGLDAETKKNLRADMEIKAVMSEIKAERDRAAASAAPASDLSIF